MKEKLLDETKQLYRDIDDTISQLVKARLHHDNEGEGKAIFRMETMMVGTLQHLSCVVDLLKDVEFTKWIKVNDRLPEIDEYVLCATKGGKYMINSMYIPKDCYGNVLGPKEWHGSGNVVNSITHWMTIVPPKEEKK